MITPVTAVVAFLSVAGLAFLSVLLSRGIPSADRICRIAEPEEGGCKVDGSECDGEKVIWDAYNFTVHRWLSEPGGMGNYSSYGIIGGNAIAGTQGTWQMYLHGPLLIPKERASELDVPPAYFQATWTN